MYNRQAIFLLAISVLFGLSACAADPTPFPAPTAIAAQPTTRPTPTSVPVPTGTSTLSPCTSEPGTLLSISLDSASIPRFQLYLPPCYQTDGNRRFPVVYLFHGATYDDGQWPRLGVTETAERLIASEEIPPFIIVMPYNRASWRNPEDDPFDQAILDSLIPYMDTHYRTLADRHYRAIGGLSRGAGWALRLGLTHPQLFARIGLHSPVIFYQDQFKIKDWLRELPADSQPSIYLDIGRSDKEHGNAAQLAALLSDAHIPLTWRLGEGTHDETYWQAQVENYLRWYAADWNSP
jgi:enterochelin esterase-like enzyme